MYVATHYFFKTRFNNIVSAHLWLVFLTAGFRTKILYVFFTFLVATTRCSRLIPLHVRTNIAVQAARSVPNSVLLHCLLHDVPSV
jgi:hypothetical protein